MIVDPATDAFFERVGGHRDIEGLLKKVPPEIWWQLERARDLGEANPLGMSRQTAAGGIYFTHASSVWNNLTGPFFMSAWFYPTGTCPTNSSAIIAAPFVTYIPFVMWYGIEVAGGAQSVCAGFWNNIAWQYTPGVTCTLNAWQWFGMQIIPNGNWRTYYAGPTDFSARETGSNSTGNVNNAAGAGSNLKIGARYDLSGATPYFPGFICDVAIWNTSYADAFQWRHAQSLSQGASPLLLGSRANLMAYWPLMGLNAVTEADLSGNGRHLTQNGSSGVGSEGLRGRPFATISR